MIENKRKELDKFRQKLEDNLPMALNVRCELVCDALVLHVQAEHIIKLLTYLRDNALCRFRQLMDITAIDYPARVNRFEVVYQLLSLRHNLRIRVKTYTDESVPVPSVTDIFSSAGWYEREVFDMYGITFAGNPDLRTILTDYGFDGHPLRKDFPLSGYEEVYYNEEEKKVAYRPVSLDQQYRDFDFKGPWEGTEYIKPEEEKAE